MSFSRKSTYEVNDTRRFLFLVSRLGEIQETFSGLMRPRSDRVSDFGLLAAEVAMEIIRLDRILAEPEVPLGETESTVKDG
jgi:hypothetical protein